MSERQKEMTTDLASQITAGTGGGHEIWRLCSQYTVVQAALLVAGHDPAMAAQVERLRPEERPTGYEAARYALEQALRRDSQMGRAVYLDDGLHGIHGIDDPIDLEKSTIWASNLKTWLSQHGFKTAFFLDTDNKIPSDGSRLDYLDPNHPRYAPKLAAAILAWQACEDAAATNGKSPKQALTAWLSQNAVRLGLADERGKPNSTGIQEAAKVANWQPAGGVPKTPSKAQ